MVLLYEIGASFSSIKAVSQKDSLMGTRLVLCANTASSLCVCSGSLQDISLRGVKLW